MNPREVAVTAVNRALLGLAVAVAGLPVALVPVASSAPWPDVEHVPARRATAPVTPFEMPFPCGQAWTGTTRDSHSPSRWSVDWNRPDDEGDDVVAAAAGRVVRVDPDGGTGYGRWVMLEHLDGEQTVYAHLDTTAVTLDQRVDQAQLLGTVGNTGNSYGAHLHFEERTTAGVVPPYFHGSAFAFGSTPTSQNCPDVPLAGSFVDGPEAEVAVYRRATTARFVVQRPGASPLVIRFGGAADHPFTGDWDGDGAVDVGVRVGAQPVFRRRTAEGVVRTRFGKVKDLPVAGDWDGDGRFEVGVRRAGSDLFRMRAADGTVTTATLGDADDLPVTGDWDGDGRTDLGVFDQATATFTLRVVDADGLTWTAQVGFGRPGDLPVAGDWDGNGTTELGTWTPTTATFSQRRATSATATRSTLRTTVFGRPR
jgi:hypothetical protein